MALTSIVVVPISNDIGQRTPAVYVASACGAPRGAGHEPARQLPGQCAEGKIVPQFENGVDITGAHRPQLGPFNNGSAPAVAEKNLKSSGFKHG